jgi:hypothetical protein
MAVLQGLVANGGHLYAAWKGEPDDDRIFFSSWSGSGSWAGATLIGGNTSAGPSLGVLGGSVYAAWKGEWSDPRVFYAKYNGSTWDAQQQIPGIYSDTGPALCQSNGKLVAAWKNVFDQNLYYATFDGSNWSGQTQISGVESSVGPSLATFNGKLYAAWQGKDSNKEIWYATYDGTSWSAESQISGVGTSVGPSLAAVGGKLYAVWKGESDDNLWYASFDGTSWSGQTQIAGVGSSMGAAIAEFNGKLYAMWKGEDSDVRLWNADFDGSTWSAQATDIPGNTGPDTYTTIVTIPAGAPVGNRNYWYIDSGDKGKSLTGTTVTILVVEDIRPVSNGSGGFENYSFQLNCWAQPQSGKFVWQQYGFRMAANVLFFWVNNYRQADLPGSPVINWDSRSTGDTVALTNNVLPAGWQLTTTLITDPSTQIVTSFSFSVSGGGRTLLAPAPFTLTGLKGTPASYETPINSFSTVMVGENGGIDTNFSAGQGIFLSYATNSLAATGTEPGDDSSSVPGTAENSNISYSGLPLSYPNGEFYQMFGVGSV